MESPKGHRKRTEPDPPIERVADMARYKMIHAIALTGAAALLLGACDSPGGGFSGVRNMQMPQISAPRLRPVNLSVSQVQSHGYQFSEQQLEQVPIGASKEQVDFVLGTPSTTGNFGNEVYYYISQKTQQTAFMRPRVIDRRILAVYFDQNFTVNRIADYGLQDGRVFDFIGRTTPTTGDEVTFLSQVLNAGNLLGGGRGS
jgi:outer membrane protein assembly factor BamE (lipoprotein component of BamABCDE complex)